MSVTNLGLAGFASNKSSLLFKTSTHYPKNVSESYWGIMRIAFIGIGALGGYFGGRLAKAGNDVTFIARGAMLEALRTDGLRVESPLGDFALTKVQATSDPADVGIVDVVFITTKAWQVREAAEQIRNTIEPETLVVPLQNGVEAYDQLKAVLSSGHVLDGMCHILAMVGAPGVVRHSGPKALITIGERNNVRTPRLDKLVECLSAAELDTRVSRQHPGCTLGEVRIRRFIWRSRRNHTGPGRRDSKPARGQVAA